MLSQSFTIATLPRFDGRQPADFGPEAGSHAQSQTAASPPRVWVVEDDRISRRTLTQLLRASGYPAEAAASAEEALRMAEAGELPRIALVDLDLPGMNGLELIDRLRGLDASIIPVVVTATSDEVLQAAVHSRGLPYVRKPIDFGRLLAVVNGLQTQSRRGDWNESGRRGRMSH